MRRITKWIGISVAALFGLAVVAYIGLLFINRSDEPPSATALAFEAIIANFADVNTPDNAFPYFVGINAPQGEDPLTQGHTWLEWSRLPIKEQRKATEPQGEYLYTQLERGETSQFSDLIKNCHSPKPVCLSTLEAQRVLLRNNLKKVQWILNRYERLLRYTKWHDPNTNSSQRFVNYIDAITLNQLYSVYVWQLAQNGNIKQALKALNLEARFWRMVLANNRTIFGKEVAGQRLNNNLRWTNAILRHAPSSPNSSVQSSWKQSITLEERSLEQAFANELVLSKSAQEQQEIIEDDVSIMEILWNKLNAPFIQSQATLNLMATHYARINQALDVPYKELTDSLTSLRQHQEDEAKQGLFRAYNPYGYLLYHIGISADFSNIGAQLADLEGKRRMLILATTLRGKGVAAGEVPSHLKSSKIKNPYTGEAFSWDANTDSITFHGLNNQDEMPYRLPY